MGTTYDANNLIRDVAPDFETLVANVPTFLKLFGASFSTSEDFLTGKPLVTNTKHEWINDKLTQYSSAIASFATDGDGVTFDVATTQGFVVDSILRFKSALGATITEQVKVTSVDANGTSITVARDYAGSTGATLVVGDVAVLNSTPQIQNSSVGEAIFHQGVAAYNYTEIFRDAAELSDTAIATSSYDGSTLMSKQVYAALVRLLRKIEYATLHGLPLIGTATAGQSMGGLLSYLTGNNAAVGGAITQNAINDVIESIYSKGGLLAQPVLLMSQVQARKVSALNTDGSNPTVFKDNQDRSIGNFTNSFVGDFSMVGGAVLAEVFVSQNMRDDQIAVIDMSNIDLAVMRGLTSTDATTPGDDGKKESLVTELTLEVRNATEAHGLITGLTL